MADGRKGDVLWGDNLTNASVVTHSHSLTTGYDADSDDSLVDISDPGFGDRVIAANREEKTRSLRQMEHDSRGDYSASQTVLASSRETANLGEQEIELQKRQQDSHTPQSLDTPNGTLSPSYNQTRHNPFDFPVQDAWLPVTLTSTTQKPSSGTGNTAQVNGNGYGQFDPLNFGDPTFVNRYSTPPPPGTLSSSRQNTSHHLYPRNPASSRGSSTVHPMTQYLDNFNTSGSSISHSSFPAITSTAEYSSDLHQSPSYSVKPVPQGVEGKAGSDNQSVTTSHPSRVVQPDNIVYQTKTPVFAQAGVAEPTNRRVGPVLDNSLQNNRYQSTDIIIKDYTFPVGRAGGDNHTFHHYSHFPASTPAQNMSENKIEYARPGKKTIVMPNNNNPHTESEGGITGHLQHLRARNERSINVGAILTDRSDSLVDRWEGSPHNARESNSDNRLVDEVSNLNRATGHHFGSHYTEDTENGLYVGNMLGGRSLSEEDMSEDRCLEETPLLDTGVPSDHRYRTSNVGGGRAGAKRVPSSQHGTPQTGEKAGAGSRTTASALDYHVISHGRSVCQYMAEELTERELVKTSGQSCDNRHARAVVDDARALRSCASGDNIGHFQRNSYGEFSPLPHFLENGAVARSGTEEVYRPRFRHCHKRRMTSLTDRLARRQLLSVVILCLLFMIGEAVGGFLANSLALFTDVLHLGSDLISFIISLLAMWLANKPATRKMSFGYHRAEVIGALFSVFIIWLVSGVLCYIAVDRILHEHYKDVRPDEMLITASLGVLFNIVMGLVLHSEMCCGHAHSHNKFGHGHSHGAGGHGHSHGAGGHGHSHNKDDLLDVPHDSSCRETVASSRREGFDYQHLHSAEECHPSDQQMRDVNSMAMASVAEESHSEENHALDDEESLHKHKNINVRAAFIHVVGDIIQSLGVLVAALIIKFTSDDKYKLADPICTFLFSLLVLITTITVLRDTLLVIMEGVPRDLSIEAMRKELAAIDGVVTVHSLHIWSLTLDRNALSVHIVVENTLIHDQVLSVATKLLQDKHHFFHTTIQVELYDEIVMKSCKECLEWN